MTPINLICFYTSGIKPLCHQDVLPNHDDWGLKYIKEIGGLPVIHWQKQCENLYTEAKSFLKEENEGVFARAWEENEKKYLAIAVAAREKGSMRRNVLVAIFAVLSETSPQKLIEKLCFSGKKLPAGLKEIKNDPKIDISTQEGDADFPTMIKFGKPVEVPKKDPNRTTTSHVPVPTRSKRRRGSLPWAIAFFMAIVAIFPYVKETNYDVSSTANMAAAVVHPQMSRATDRIVDLENENIELRQKLDAAHSKLRSKVYELEEKDTIVTEIGGWQSLEVLIRVSKKYQIDRAEKLQVVFDKFKREIEQLKREKQQAQQSYNHHNKTMEFMKSDMQNLVDRIDQELSTNNSNSWKVVLKHCKKKLQDLLGE